MDQNSEQELPTSPYRPSEWHAAAVPESDAAIALKNNDHRLLAFALRTTHVPGIKPELVQTYRERCGLRLLKGFGDVIRSEGDLKRMKQASEYVQRYNAVIISECSLSQ